jgi:hypothetical protein
MTGRDTFEMIVPLLSILVAVESLRGPVLHTGVFSNVRNRLSCENNLTTEHKNIITMNGFFNINTPSLVFKN